MATIQVPQTISFMMPLTTLDPRNPWSNEPTQTSDCEKQACSAYTYRGGCTVIETATQVNKVDSVGTFICTGSPRWYICSRSR